MAVPCTMARNYKCLVGQLFFIPLITVVLIKGLFLTGHWLHVLHGTKSVYQAAGVPCSNRFTEAIFLCTELC